MKEYLKNKNEYIEDGKLFVEEISECSCNEIKDGYYSVRCKIIQRGKHTYWFDRNSNEIKKPYSAKGFGLSENALKKVEEAADGLDKKIERIISDGYVKADIDALNKILYYRHSSDTLYDIMIESYINEKKDSIAIHESITIGEMIGQIIWNTTFNCGTDKNMRDIIFQSGDETILSNPVYVSAVENNDELLQRHLKLHYRIASSSDCKILERIFDRRILPSLSNEFDRMFIVDSGNIKVSLLDNSGYRILHRPYFAMKNSTHEKWQLNPHTKTGVDAAKDDDVSMTFSEYLELFNDARNIQT